MIMTDVADMEQSKNNIIKYTNNQNIITRKTDLTSFESVRDFASFVNQNESRLDILINNAGIGHSKPDLTSDGLNQVMQVNYLSHFLLTHLLLGKLEI